MSVFSGKLEQPVSAQTAAEEHSSRRLDIISTRRWIPQAPPKLMEKLEGWGYSRMPDLTGKVFIVTGGNSGTGEEAARHLAAAGAHVVIASPDRERAEDAINSMRRQGAEGHALKGILEYIELDLSDMGSIRAFARRFQTKQLPLHGLLCNAAVQLRAQRRTNDGLELPWGTNYIGHFYLAHLLFDDLRRAAPSRLVFMGSEQEEIASHIPWEDPLGLNPEPTADWYGPSKLANVMMALEFNRRLGLEAQNSGVDVFAAHPGICQTDLFRKYTRRTPTAYILDWAQSFFGQSAYRGAMSITYAATEPSLAGKGGQYFGCPYRFQQSMQVFQFSSLNVKNRIGMNQHARYRLYEQTADALEQFIGEPLPNRLSGIAPVKERAKTLTGGGMQRMQLMAEQ